MEKPRNWLDHVIYNWVRWCRSGPAPGPLPPQCGSLESDYIPEGLWATDPDDRPPPPIHIDDALKVQRIYTTLSIVERRVVKAEYVATYESKRWTPNGLCCAASYANVTVQAYESMIYRARQRIASEFE